MQITYCDDAHLSVEQVIDLFKKSTLGERRPVDRPDVFAAMINNADIIISAWHGEKLVGIARSLTDFSYVTYLADLAVDELVAVAGREVLVGADAQVFRPGFIQCGRRRQRRAALPFLDDARIAGSGHAAFAEVGRDEDGVGVDPADIAFRFRQVEAAGDETAPGDVEFAHYVRIAATAR